MPQSCRQWLLTTACIAAIAAGSVAVAGAAPKPGPGSTTASIQLATPAGAAATQNYTPARGSMVNFITTVPGTAKNPSIEIDCYQNGVFVWGTITSTTDSTMLGAASSQWVDNGGGAHCTATLEDIVWVRKMQTKTTLAVTSFDASA